MRNSSITNPTSGLPRTQSLSFVDSHLHLADSSYSSIIGEIIQDATANNVSYLLSNAMDYHTSIVTLEIAKKYPQKVLAAVGVHPWTANSNANCQLNKFEELLNANSQYVKAIGEIGLDGKYNQNEKSKKSQQEVFEFFLQIAEKRRLPVVVHSRLAAEEALETLTRYTLPSVLMHWYDGPCELLHQIEDRGYLISIGPAVTYSRRIIEIAKHADLSLILTETDGPVSYGGPFKDRATRPSFVIDVARRLMEIKSQSLETVQAAILRNFERLTT